MKRQPAREPRCRHCLDQPASKCIVCRDGEELKAWYEYWAWRRSQVEWTFEPHVYVTSDAHTILRGYDPVVRASRAVSLPWMVLYWQDMIVRGAQAIENELFSLPVLGDVSKDDAIRRALATEMFNVDPLTGRPYKRPGER